MKRVSQFVVHQPMVALADVFLMHLAFLLAFMVRFGAGLRGAETNFKAYAHMAPFMTVSTLAVFYVSDLYTNWLRRSATRLVAGVVTAVLLQSLATMALTFWMRWFAFPRSVLGMAFAVAVTLIGTYRVAVRQMHRSFFTGRRVLLVGEDESSVTPLAGKFLQYASEWFEVADFLPSNDREELEARLECVDVVLLASQVERKAEIVGRCSRRGKEVLVVPSAFELSLASAEVQDVDDVLLLCVRPPRLNPAELFLKRLLDLAGATLGLALASPIIAVLWAAIPMTSKGPAIFRQERIGRNGKKFDVYKFRTMRNDAEERTGPVLASMKDPRITKLGSILRATRLDEIPQLWNVMTGDMSLVGPRPEREFFVDQFQQQMPDYELRHAVKPGVTGLAQVMGRYTTTAERKLRFDLMYVYGYSFVLDLKILMQTVRVVFQRHQAAGLSGNECSGAEWICRVEPSVETATDAD